MAETKFKMTRDGASHQVEVEIYARNLRDGRVELWATENSLKHWGKGKWHTKHIITVLEPDAVAKLRTVLNETPVDAG